MSPASKTAKPVLLVGAGKMGLAMLKGWRTTDHLPTRQIMVLEPTPSPTLQNLVQGSWDNLEIQLNPATDAIKAANPAMVFFAVKPQLASEILPPIAPLLSPDCLALSILAGVRLASLSHYLGERKIIRAMPNLSAAIGQSMTVLCANKHIAQADRKQAEAFMGAIGKMVWLEHEADIDIATAISGSGPAYVFYLTETLTAAAVKLGLPQALAVQLARETVAGAGQMLRQSAEEASVLREQVTSPAGTTAAALKVLMAEGELETLIYRAAEAAATRSRELAS